MGANYSKTPETDARESETKTFNREEASSEYLNFPDDIRPFVNDEDSAWSLELTTPCIVTAPAISTLKNSLRDEEELTPRIHDHRNSFVYMLFDKCKFVEQNEKSGLPSRFYVKTGENSWLKISDLPHPLPENHVAKFKVWKRPHYGHSWSWDVQLIVSQSDRDTGYLYFVKRN